jgi:hypothetical protein
LNNATDFICICCFKDATRNQNFGSTNVHLQYNHHLYVPNHLGAMPPIPLIPSSFLPPLPRSQNSFEPLSTTDLLAHIAVLRGLYIPPVHGGFEVSDCLLEDEDSSGQGHGRTGDNGESLSGAMDGLGLDVGSTAVDIPSNSSSSSDINNEQSREPSDEDESEEEEESREHLDPFERDWSEKWLNGVVRRAQGWLEENEPEDSDEVAQGVWRVMESILRDASAALAMMAGTSGMFPFYFSCFDRRWRWYRRKELMHSNGLLDPSSRLSTGSGPRARTESTTTQPPLKPSTLASSSYFPFVTRYFTNIASHVTPTTKYFTPISNLIKVTNQEAEKSTSSSRLTTRCTYGQSLVCRCTDLGLGNITREANGEISRSIRFIQCIRL